MEMPTLASRVRAVTVFRRGALVTREARLSGAPPERVRITGLPLTLDDNSLRVELHGEGALAIASDVRVTIAVPDADPTLPPPDDAELEAAELDHAQLQRELGDLQRALASLTKLEPGPRGEAKPGREPIASPLAARLELLGFRRERADALIVRIAELEARGRVVSERASTLRERKRVASQARNVRPFEVRKAAEIRLDARGSAGGPMTLRLTYFVSGARWTPAYTIRLDASMRAATFELRALVGQSSGEDWTDVALVLSTASPQQWTELPELRAQKIGRAQPEPAKTGWRPPPIGAGELYADYDRDLGERPSSGGMRITDGAASPLAEPSPVARGGDMGTRTQAGTIDPASVAQFNELLASAMDEGAPRRPPSAPPSFAAPPGAAMAMPVPMSPPMPSRMAAPQSMRKRSAGPMLGGFGGGGHEEEEKEKAYVDLEEASDLLPAEPSELVAGRELLDYGRLRLHPAANTQRGALRRVDQRVAYQQRIVGHIQFDAAYSQVEVALGQARSFESASAPTRHRFPAGEAGFDYAYVADAAIDLASDGKFHSLAIRSDAAEATPRYVTVPRETQDVFRIVALRNPLNAPLLPGPADVYVAGRFALTSDVELTPVGGRLELGLGVEQAIKIARNVKFEEDTTGLIKRQHALIHTIEVEVGNNLASAAKVEVRERLPIVPTGLEGDIQVTLREAKPRWEDYEQASSPIEGGRMWTIDVPAGEQRKLEATWVITIPNQHELLGGNRRES